MKLAFFLGCFLLGTAANSHMDMTLADWKKETPGKQVMIWQYVSDCSVVISQMPQWKELMATYKPEGPVLIATTDIGNEAGVHAEGYNLTQYLKYCATGGSCVLYGPDGDPDRLQRYSYSMNYGDLLKWVTQNLGPPVPPAPTPPPSPGPPTPTPPHDCQAQCVAAGHCCTGVLSSFNHPSCAMGCIISGLTSSVDECKQICLDNDGKCMWSLKGNNFNNCEDCPQGCSSKDGVQECLQGCVFSSNSTNPQPLQI